MTRPVSDPYRVLGVPRGASEEQIRNAFRRLARENHPDLHPDDPGAQERFKEVNAAFQLLSNEERRAHFDRFGQSGAPPGGAWGPPTGVDLEELFGQVFSSAGRRRSADAAAVSHVIELEFVEAALGCTKEVRYERMEDCERCEGSGAEPGTHSRRCPTCGGRGRLDLVAPLLGVSLGSQPCPTCHGTGASYETPCAHCAGRGLVRRAHRLSVAVPPGVEDGASQEIIGVGDRAVPGGPRGDMTLVIRVGAHPDFRREEDDIVSQATLSFSQAARGTELNVSTLRGETVLRIPAGAQHGDRLRIRRAGVEHRYRSGVGDHWVELKVTVPTARNDEQRAKIRQLGSELESRERGVFERIRDWF